MASKRVQALQDYLKDKNNIDINIFKRVNFGEDWKGLRHLIEKSDMQYKTEVLAIIDNVPVMRGREKQLMDLKWGRPYNYMMEHFFPKLRNAGYIRVFYETKPNEDFGIINQAIDLYSNNKYDQAIAKLEGIEPTASTELIRGVCQMVLGAYDHAEQSLRRANDMGNPQAAESLEQLKKLRAIERYK